MNDREVKHRCGGNADSVEYNCEIQGRPRTFGNTKCRRPDRVDLEQRVDRFRLDLLARDPFEDDLNEDHDLGDSRGAASSDISHEK